MLWLSYIVVAYSLYRIYANRNWGWKFFWVVVALVVYNMGISGASQTPVA